MTLKTGHHRASPPPWSITSAKNAFSADQTANDNVQWQFGTSGGESYIASNGTDTIWQMVSGGLTIGLGASAPVPDQDGVHIWKATSGAVTAPTNTLVILENSTHAYIAILTPTNGEAGLITGGPDGSPWHGLYMRPSAVSGGNTNSWAFLVAGTVRLRYAATAFAFQEATTISTTTGALTLAPNSGSLLFTGTLALTGSRVTQSYHTNITSTNAVTVDSWSASKEQIRPYAGDALAILRGTEVISFRHRLDRDASGRVKLGVRAESIHEPLTLLDMDYGHGLGVGPALDTMGLTALNTRAIQQIEDILHRLERENQELRALVAGRSN